MASSFQGLKKKHLNRNKAIPVRKRLKYLSTLFHLVAGVAAAPIRYGCQRCRVDLRESLAGPAQLTHSAMTEPLLARWLEANDRSHAIRFQASRKDVISLGANRPSFQRQFWSATLVRNVLDRGGGLLSTPCSRRRPWPPGSPESRVDMAQIRRCLNTETVRYREIMPVVNIAVLS